MEVPQDQLATVFRSAGFAKEVEAQLVRGMLESNGLPAFITGTETMPGPYRFAAREICVQVPYDRRDEAVQLIAKAKASDLAAVDIDAGADPGARSSSTVKAGNENRADR